MLINKNGVFNYPKKDNRREITDVRKGVKITIPKEGQNYNGTIKKAVVQKLHSMTVGDAVHLYDKYGVIIEAV
jgi:hypothetical protein